MTSFPIDYSADLVIFLSIVAWAVLMKGGIGLIAKFKIFAEGDENSMSSYGRPLPSWVIDWRLAARRFRKRVTETNSTNDSLCNLEDAWKKRPNLDISWPNSCAVYASTMHKQFCQENSGSGVPCTNLVVRGVVGTQFHFGERCIWRHVRKEQNSIKSLSNSTSMSSPRTSLYT
ncbi:hypothetical protein B0J14DRAFT_572025 [Halenospora varia]|nr:hypothetical protein B0J14DRAFT_572025 [Halenospora varia]